MMGTQDGAEIGPQRELLTLVLTEDPVRLSVAELQDRLGDPVDVRAAMEVLIADGLLVLEGDEVVPTSATTRFYELMAILG
jgi:hypothetical protein